MKMLLSFPLPDQQQQQYASSELSKLPDPNRIRSRVPPNMPKLFIPSTVTKFPPEITVTPPTPTLLSPKGSISEETKQRLKVSSSFKHELCECLCACAQVDSSGVNTPDASDPITFTACVMCPHYFIL